MGTPSRCLVDRARVRPGELGYARSSKRHASGTRAGSAATIAERMAEEIRGAELYHYLL